MSISKFETMLKTKDVYFFDALEFEEIIQHYFNIGKHSLADKALKLGIKQHPSSIILKLLKSELFIFQDKVNEAINILNEVEAIEPYNDEVFIQRAIIFSKKRNHKQALSILNKSLSFVQNIEDVYSLMGMEYLYLEDYENAKLNFSKCLKIDINDYSSLYNVIYCYEMNNQYIEAISFLNNYIETNPYSEIAWHQLGKQYFALKMYKEALISFDYAVVIDDSFIGAYIEKAKTFEKLKKYDKAIKNYMITLKLDDPTSYVYMRIGKCFNKLKNINQAIFFYKKSVHENPFSDKVLFLLTKAFIKLKKYDKALSYIKKTIEVNDLNVVYWKKYVNLNLRLNLKEEAVKGLKKCINLGVVEINLYLKIVDVLCSLDRYKESLKFLIFANNKFRKLAVIEYRFCGLFMLMNKKNFSLSHLKKGLLIDYKCHSIVKDLYPSVFSNNDVQKVICDFK